VSSISFASLRVSERKTRLSEVPWTSAIFTFSP
jgi:hypothetical protein